MDTITALAQGLGRVHAHQRLILHNQNDLRNSAKFQVAWVLHLNNRTCRAPNSSGLNPRLGLWELASQNLRGGCCPLQRRDGVAGDGRGRLRHRCYCLAKSRSYFLAWPDPMNKHAHRSILVTWDEKFELTRQLHRWTIARRTPAESVRYTSPKRAHSSPSEMTGKMQSKFPQCRPFFGGKFTGERSVASRVLAHHQGDSHD
jgi:hypothetical protein